MKTLCNFGFGTKFFLLSKALKLQQENEDRKNKFIINDLEKKIKNLENSLTPRLDHWN
jgi:hypothetical protein